MSINLKIEAEVIDIKSDCPKQTDIFLVDSNVWYWLTYSHSSAIPYQLKDYPSYINKVMAVQARLLWCGLSLAEIAHLVEKSEREIFSKSINPKEYRHNYPSERIKVVAEIQTMWAQVKSLAEPIEILVDEATTDLALNRFNTQLLDGYDLFMVEAMSKKGVIQILTDDGDFSTIPGFRVFTSNKNVIEVAKKHGKLIQR